jgi:hypothetical protein
MKKEIRLNESEFLRLIKRIVEETEKQEKKQKVSIFNISDAVDMAKDMAEDMLKDLDDDEIEGLVDSLPDALDGTTPQKIERELQRMVKSEDGQEMLGKVSDTISESYLFESSSKKIISLLSKAGILSGIGLTAAGLIGFMSNAMGYTAAGFMTSYLVDVHDMIQNEFGCDMFCGPLSTLIGFIGMFMALASAKYGYENK